MKPTCNYYASGTCGHRLVESDSCTTDSCEFFSDTPLTQKSPNCPECIDPMDLLTTHQETPTYNPPIENPIPPLPEPESLSFPSTNTQIGGDHYLKYKIQPITFFLENSIPFTEASIIKYILRHRDKNGLEDLRKAKHLITLLEEHHYGQTR